MYVKAYAKLNISLDVLGKRNDGFHEMLMVMQQVDLFDDIEITVDEGNGNICVITNRPYIPQNEKNIAGKAARLFMDEAGITDKNISISIKKKIPVCAGLGGGSSDAAAVLLGMNNIFTNAVSKERLFELAEQLGSDVPFCLLGGTALASGRGERMEPLSALPDCWIIISKPEFSISTPELFNKLDSCKLSFRPDTKGLVRAIEKGDIKGVAQRCYNVFEDVLSKRHRSIVDSLKDMFITTGACGSAMSGTGSACFGIYEHEDTAKAAFKVIKERYKDSFLINIGNESL